MAGENPKGACSEEHSQGIKGIRGTGGAWRGLWHVECVTDTSEPSAQENLSLFPQEVKIFI